MMITLEQWMKLVEHVITDTSYYGWSCYGPNAYRFESWDGNHDGYSMEIIFDTKSLEAMGYEIDRMKVIKRFGDAKK
jgi:hypothetical protein